MSTPRPAPTPSFERTSVAIPLGVELSELHAVYDGDAGRKTNHGNFIGVYGFTTGTGRWHWYAENGDHGECYDATEAETEIRDTWYGRPDERKF